MDVSNPTPPSLLCLASLLWFLSIRSQELTVDHGWDKNLPAFVVCKRLGTVLFPDDKPGTFTII